MRTTRLDRKEKWLYSAIFWISVSMVASQGLASGWTGGLLACLAVLMVLLYVLAMRAKDSLLWVGSISIANILTSLACKLVSHSWAVVGIVALSLGIHCGVIPLLLHRASKLRAESSHVDR